MGGTGNTVIRNLHCSWCGTVLFELDIKINCKLNGITENVKKIKNEIHKKWNDFNDFFIIFISE